MEEVNLHSRKTSAEMFLIFCISVYLSVFPASSVFFLCISQGPHIPQRLSSWSSMSLLLDLDWELSKEGYSCQVWFCCVRFAQGDQILFSLAQVQILNNSIDLPDSYRFLRWLCGLVHSIANIFR